MSDYVKCPVCEAGCAHDACEPGMCSCECHSPRLKKEIDKLIILKYWAIAMRNSTPDDGLDFNRAQINAFDEFILQIDSLLNEGDF